MLELELTYLTSPMRLLSLMEKKKEILQGKRNVTAEQIYHKDEITNLAKLKVFEKTKIAKKHTLQTIY
jgi:hypothetical protein